MFWLASLPVLAVVALGPQVVLASFKFSFSPVGQCEPVKINFTGGDSNNHFVPTQLTILPLGDNALPIQIPIPNGASNSTGIELTFIPIPANTRFVATLDDDQGPAAKVSDVIRVNTAVPPDSSCLSSSSVANFYNIPQVFNQCENFTVGYNTTSAPNITAFTPRDGSFEITLVQDSPPGQAVYVMNGQRDDEVVLLLNDTENHAQTSNLITIGGDTSSSKTCLMPKGPNSSNLGHSTTKSSALPKPAIIGIAVGAAVIVFAALLLLWYILHRRRRQRLAPSIQFDPALLSRRWPSDEKEKKIDLFEQETQSTARWRLDGERVDLFGQPSTAISPPSSGGDYVHDPLYTNDRYRTSAMTGDRSVRTSISSWNQFIPEDQRGEQIPAARRSSFSSSRLSLNTVDAQHILEMARVHRESTDGGPTAYQSRTPQPSTAGTAFDLSKSTAASTHRAQQTSDPPDMPVVLSRNNSASAAALTAVPAPYMSTSYIPFDGDHEDASGTPRAINDGSGIGDYPVPQPFGRLNRP